MICAHLGAFDGEQGQSQLVTCSGVFKDGSLRCIRNGIGISMTVSCHGSCKPSSVPFQAEWTLSPTMPLS